MLSQQQQQDPQQQPIAITLPLGAWQSILGILNDQPYGKVAVLIAAIIEQANRAQASAQPRANGSFEPPNYAPPNDGT